VILTRILFLIGVVLLIAGGCFVGNYKSANQVSLGDKLVKAGYIVVAAILAILIAFQAYLCSYGARLSRISTTVRNTTSPI
jgi:hypothetical protein